MSVRVFLRALCGLFVALLSVGGARGEAVSLITSAAAPLIQIRASVPDGAAMPAPHSAASLFTGTSAGSLFAPYPARTRRAPPVGQPSAAVVQPLGPVTPMSRVRALIAQAEAGPAGFDAVQYGAKIKPTKKPTQMTLQEIYDWIAATPGQPHAIGRYQFIPKTLKRLVTKAGLPLETVFSAGVQDRLADILLTEAGYHAFQRGELGRHAFMYNLSKIWAGLPTSSGKSYYHGHAGNKATMTWAHFDAEMARIFPAAQEPAPTG